MLRAVLPFVAAAETHSSPASAFPEDGAPKGRMWRCAERGVLQRRWPSMAREARKVLVPPQLKPSPWGELAQALLLGPRFWGLVLGAQLSQAGCTRRLRAGGGAR